MNTEEIHCGLLGILRDELNISAPLSPDTALLGDGVLDSMDFMNYITRVEETFNISISNQDLAAYQLGIVRNMVAYLDQRLRSRTV
jgi:acyl carrier protein